MQPVELSCTVNGGGAARAYQMARLLDVVRAVLTGKPGEVARRRRAWGVGDRGWRAGE